MAEVLACRETDIPSGGVRIVKIGGVDVGIYRHDGQLYAYRNLCLHQGGPACEGVMLPGVREMLDEEGKYHGQTFDEGDPHIICPWHGYEYHLKTGECVGQPSLKLQRFEVIERGGEVYVDVGT